MIVWPWYLWHILSQYVTVVIIIYVFLNQQFIIQSARVNYSSYFVTIYIKIETIWREGIRKRKEDNKGREEENKNNLRKSCLTK